MYELRRVYKLDDGMVSEPLEYRDLERTFNREPDCFGIYVDYPDGRQMWVADFPTLKEAKKAFEIVSSVQLVCEVAAVAAIMSDHAAKRAYDVLSDGYIAMAYSIADWALEFVHKHLYIDIMEDGWENVMEDPEKYRFSTDSSCWDDFVMEYVDMKINEHMN